MSGESARLIKFRGWSGRPVGKRVIGFIVSAAAVALVTASVVAWPPPPGIRERGRLKTDTWETLRRESPWKQPLSGDPVYRRLGGAYRRMEDLDNRAAASGWKSSREYRQMRFQLDKYYAGARAVVFALRSSGTEESRNGPALIETAIRTLEGYLAVSIEQAKELELNTTVRN